MQQNMSHFTFFFQANTNWFHSRPFHYAVKNNGLLNSLIGDLQEARAAMFNLKLLEKLIKAHWSHTFHLKTHGFRLSDRKLFHQHSGFNFSKKKKSPL